MPPFRRLFLACAVLASLGLSACGYNISPYGVSVKNVTAIKAINAPPVAVAPFESSNPGLSSISCRAAGPVRTSDKTSFEAYIQKAFVDELQLAGHYDAQSPIVIHGVLREVDFNSNIGAGKWIFSLAVSSNKSPGFTVETKHGFSTNWVADKACQQVAQEFGPAVQQLISEVISNPSFPALAQ